MTDGDAGFIQGATWSWGGMTLAYLYTQLSEATNPTIGSIVGYMSLLKVVTFFFSISYYKRVDIIVFVYACDAEIFVCIYLC
jgi:hypothetical protein